MGILEKKKKKAKIVLDDCNTDVQVHFQCVIYFPHRSKQYQLQSLKICFAITPPQEIKELTPVKKEHIFLKINLKKKIREGSD